MELIPINPATKIYLFLMFLFSNLPVSTGYSTLGSTQTTQVKILDHVADKITQVILEHIEKQRKSLEISCSLKLHFDQNQNNFSLVRFSSYNEPVQTFVEFYNHTSANFSPSTKFRSICWNIVLVFTLLDDSKSDNRKSIGNPVFDHFLLISPSLSLLKHYLSPNFGFLNLVSWKYGLHISNLSPNFQLEYLIEPISYTGLMVTIPYTNFTFQRRTISNNLNGRVLRSAYVSLAPFIVKIPGTNIFDGISYHILMEIAARTNSSINFYQPKSPGFGIYLGNGAWTGVI